LSVRLISSFLCLVQCLFTLLRGNGVV
jgi:hypothetical protein